MYVFVPWLQEGHYAFLASRSSDRTLARYTGISKLEQEKGLLTFRTFLVTQT